MNIKSVYYSALLHDIGKMIIRANHEKKTHSLAGSEYVGKYITDNLVIEAVRYHHADELKKKKLNNDHIAYIIYEADNIASKGDRRKEDTVFGGFDAKMPLYSIFNLVKNDNVSTEKAYGVSSFDMNSLVIYSEDVQVAKNKSTEYAYSLVYDKFNDIFKELNFGEDVVDSVLQLIESTCSYIPSSTACAEVPDISLYNHLKLTAAYASCMYSFCVSNNLMDFRHMFFDTQTFRDEKAFLFLSADLSGIQNYIYGISSKGALKSLRGRSFYLEMMTENIIDEMLDFLELNRVNLIYSGGGHFYMLLPNTSGVRNKISEIKKNLGDKFMNNFGTSLYLSMDYVECSANELMNSSEKNTLGEIYRDVGEKISKDKLQRYDYDQLSALFDPDSVINNEANSGNRECSVCRNSVRKLRAVKWSDGEVCPVCEGTYELGNRLAKINETEMLLAVTEDIPESDSYVSVVSLHENEYISFVSVSEYHLLREKASFKRLYSINNPMVGVDFATNIWVGTYGKEDADGSIAEFSALSHSSCGINRIGVLRADLDNLGNSFKNGFKTSGGNPHKYVTLSRFATLSSELSLFFKYKINELCRRNECRLFHSKEESTLSIVYSGGDDVFIVGAWNEVLDFSVTLSKAVKKFTNNKFSLSGGFGIFTDSYPVYLMAKDTAILEDAAKNNPGKDSIALFGVNEKGDCEHIYKWDEFINDVLGEKYAMMCKWFYFSEETPENKLYAGNSFLYKIMELFRNANNDEINIARFAYQLGRIQPSKDASEEIKKIYKEMSSKMLEWIRNKDEIRKVITAINLIVYYNREGDK